MAWLIYVAVILISYWFDLKLDIYVQSNHICTGASDWRKIVIRNHVQSGLAAVAEWLRRLAKSRIHIGSNPTDCRKLFHSWTGQSTHYFLLEFEIKFWNFSFLKLKAKKIKIFNKDFFPNRDLNPHPPEWQAGIITTMLGDTYQLQSGGALQRTRWHRDDISLVWHRHNIETT